MTLFAVEDTGRFEEGIPWRLIWSFIIGRTSENFGRIRGWTTIGSKSITTTAHIGGLCEAAMFVGEGVFIHRCGWGAERFSICCAVKVAEVSRIDGRTSLGKFAEAVLLGCDPPVTPGRGQNFYECEPVEIKKS